MEAAIEIIGFILLWAATNVGRKKESKIKFLSRQWFLIAGLLGTGATIISIADDLVGWFY